MAQGVSDCIAEWAPEAQVRLTKDNPNSQDFGATLVLLFGTPVAIAFAKAVTVYLQRRRSPIASSINGRERANKASFR